MIQWCQERSESYFNGNTLSENTNNLWKKFHLCNLNQIKVSNRKKNMTQIEKERGHIPLV